MACPHSWPERLGVLDLGLAIALAASGCRNVGQDAEDVSTATILWPGEYLSDIGLRWVDSELKFLVFLPLPEPLPYDPVEAERLLEEAGWRDVDGDGVRELSADQSGADGRELEFSLLTWPAWERGAVFVQAQWQRIGANAKILTLDSGVLRERIRAGDFDAAITGIMTEPLGWVALLHIFGHDSPAGYINPREISLLEDALGTTHPDRVDAIYRQLAHIVLRDLPYLFLGAESETFVAHCRLKGLSTPFRANPTWAMEHLWIEGDG